MYRYVYILWLQTDTCRGYAPGDNGANIVSIDFFQELRRCNILKINDKKNIQIGLDKVTKLFGSRFHHIMIY